MKKTAILIDGGFFFNCIQDICGILDTKSLVRICENGADLLLSRYAEGFALEGVYFYDSLTPESGGITRNPVTRQVMDRSKAFRYRAKFLEHIVKFGRINPFIFKQGIVRFSPTWTLTPAAVKKLLKRPDRQDAIITDSDLHLKWEQKAVDMQLGIDIADLSFNQRVNQIVLISGDTDFGPALALARKYGVEVVLDPMEHPNRKGQIRLELWAEADHVVKDLWTAELALATKKSPG